MLNLIEDSWWVMEMSLFSLMSHHEITLITNSRFEEVWEILKEEE